jgi:hypothetical protein
MHAFNLDFGNVSQASITKQVKKIFPINSNINLYEGYTETWAKILNCVMISYVITNSLEPYLNMVDTMLKIERQYIMFQMTKLLDFMRLTYNDLYSKDRISMQKRMAFYREDTNFFAYFVISAILMNDYEGFIVWCYKNNPHFIRFNSTSRNITKFIKYIGESSKKSDMIERAEIFDQANTMINNKSNMYKSCRFTIIELM